MSWSHNLAIMSRCKRDEEREFYLRMASKERWSFRELQRQLNGALFERVVLAPVKVAPVVRQIHPDASKVFRDSYLIEFLNLPDTHSEGDLQTALMANLRRFLLELGGDFTFVGERYRLQVGGRDFFVDLLFYHRDLSCLVALELKGTEFEPADVGQLQFYLEALDRDVKKPHEQPSIGVLLCATKDSEVVEYALARTVPPPWWPNTRPAYPTRSSCKPSCMSSMPWPNPKPRRGHPVRVGNCRLPLCAVTRNPGGRAGRRDDQNATDAGPWKTQWRGVLASPCSRPLVSS